MAAAPPDTDWRDAMTREDRIKVCRHIMTKLSTYYQMVPQQALREKTCAFELQAYTHAESRTDYIRRIAGGLSNVERQVQQQATYQQGGGGAPDGARGGGAGGGGGGGAGGGGSTVYNNTALAASADIGVAGRLPEEAKFGKPHRKTCTIV